MSSSMNRAVIFDMDGVLVDTEPIYFAVNRQTLKTLGVGPDDVDLSIYVGSSADRMWSELKERFQLAPEISELSQLEREGFHRALQSASLQPIPGILKLIEKVQQINAGIGLASSSSCRNIDLIIGKAGLKDKIPVITSGEEVIHGKPAPDIFLLAAKRLGIAPEHCLVLEDSPLGIAGARKAGMKTVGFRNPSSGNQDLSAADIQIDDIGPDSREQLIKLLLT